ncbi:hypothetical protein ACVW17_003388 [Bradyrhizobium sp. USDA 4473]
MWMSLGSMCYVTASSFDRCDACVVCVAASKTSNSAKWPKNN